MMLWLERIFAFWAIVTVCAMLVMISYAYLRPVVRAVVVGAPGRSSEARERKKSRRDPLPPARPTYRNGKRLTRSHKLRVDDATPRRVPAVGFEPTRAFARTRVRAC